MTTNNIKASYELAKNFTKEKEVIGIQKEKILHKTLKYYLAKDDTKHEIQIKRENKKPMYADVVESDIIYEIQTRGFNKLREKLDCFLKLNKVVVVYPLANLKNIYKIDEFGEVTGPRKSPKKGCIFNAFYELYKIKSYLKNDNLSIRVIMLNMDEYRTITKKVHYRSSGYIKDVQIPLDVVKEYNLNNVDDYINLLLEYNLPPTFTTTQFYKIVHVTKKIATTSLNVLYYLGAVNRVGKKGNSYIYSITKK